MIKVRSTTELTDALAKELTPRKRELTAIKLAMLSARDHQKKILLRAGFVMIYAHFEGFVRFASTAYVAYVSHQNLGYADLKPNFVGVGLKSQLQDLGIIEKASVVRTTVEKFIYGMKDTAAFTWTGEMDSRNNLNRDVLREIFALTGLDSSWYETKWAFIDEILLANRNDIAHGRMTTLDESVYIRAHDKTIELLEHFRTDVENAAVTKAFLRH